MKHAALAGLTALVGLVAVSPASADEVEDALAAALEAYKAGDVTLATEEAEYAQQLLAQMKASSLSGFLPEAPEGWVREDGESGGMPGLGGMMANASYQGPEHDVEIQLMANNQMVASMMMVFNNPMMIGQMGELKRIGRQKVILTKEGDLQAMLDNNVLVVISGSAPETTKETFFGAIDIEGLKGF